MPSYNRHDPLLCEEIEAAKHLSIPVALRTDKNDILIGVTPNHKISSKF